MEQGKNYPESYIEPTHCASWIKRLLDQKKVTIACMSWRTLRGDKVEDLIKRADAISKQNIRRADQSRRKEQNVRRVDLFD